MASLVGFLGTEDTSQLPPSAVTNVSLEWLQDKALEFVTQIVAVPRDTHDKGAYQMSNRHRCFLHAALLYWGLRNAVRYDHGPRIIVQYR